MKLKLYPLIRNCVLLFLIFFFNCSCAEDKSPRNTLINTSHLDFLYEQINIAGNKMGIIHIYSNYPDYKWIGDDDEGIACVDDAARAAIFYMNYYSSTSDTGSLNKAEHLVNFLLYMQAENGFYYNFIWPDHSINKTFKTSVAEPNWWSWRAILTLSKAYTFFKDNNAGLSRKIETSLDKAVSAVDGWLDGDNSKKYVSYGGLKFPEWLPYGTAADQSAILLEGLTDYYQIKKEPGVLRRINLLGEGILQMQKGDSSAVPYSAFLSWQNTWHAWGNSQAASLLYAGKILNRNDFISGAIKEVKYFYPYLLKENYLTAFKVEAENGENKLTDVEKFSQIAYGIRPDVFACIRAFQVTEDKKYLETGLSIAGWLFGHNAAGMQMYDPQTGRCFDGIKDSTTINKNSGAESTIEALLSLEALEENPVSKEMLLELYRKK